MDEEDARAGTLAAGAKEEADGAMLLDSLLSLRVILL